MRRVPVPPVGLVERGRDKRSGPGWREGEPQGWCAHREKLIELVREHRPQAYVELGSWRGLSLVLVGREVRAWGGVVYGVDSWAGGTKQGPSVAGERRCPWMVGECAASLVMNGVSPWVRLIVAQTSEAGATWSGPIDFLYVDADHSAAGCLEDLRVWVPKVRSGGIVCGDDYDNPNYPGVKVAWDEYEWETGQGWVREPLTSVREGRFVWGVKR